MVLTSLPSPKAVLFDWDNTLVDTWPTIHAALNQTYEAFGKDQWSLNEVKAKVRYSLRDTFPDYFGERWKDATNHFYSRFEELHLTELKPLEDAETLLETLRARDIYVGVVSNKTGQYLRKEVSHLGWDRFFNRLVGAGDAARDKPAPDPVHMALEDSGILPDTSVWFVGDSNVDMEVAHATGCTAVLVNQHDDYEDERFAGWPPHYRSPDCKTLLSAIEEASV